VYASGGQGESADANRNEVSAMADKKKDKKDKKGKK